jgi:hypothetical protein
MTARTASGTLGLPAPVLVPAWLLVPALDKALPQALSR